MHSLLTNVCSVGFSGSRCPSNVAIASLESVLPLVPVSHCRISVGCAAGVDSIVREFFAGSPSLLVFSASSPRFARAGAVGALALRSAACARSVSRAGLLLVLPSGACPSGVRPSRSFRGCGSGSWGTAALAAGLGRRVVVFLAPGLVPPVWAGFEWSSCGSGWWCLQPVASRVVQLSLF